MKRQTPTPSKDPNNVNPSPFKRSTLAIFFVIWAVALAAQYYYGQQDLTTFTYSEFIKAVEDGQVKEVTLSENQIVGQFNQPNEAGDERFTTVPVKDDQLVPLLRQKNVNIKGTVESTFWTTLLSWVIPLLLLFLFWRFLFGQMNRNSQGGLLSLGKSKARIYMEKDTKTTFADVAGVDEAKEELEEVVHFLKEPERYTRLGGRSPKGILLVGPPGTGKTLLARAIAGEASVPFFSINGSEFVEMFVGLGAARVRDLFEQARKTAPCILFIDELDALGKSRSSGGMNPSGSNDEKEQTLNQLLAELDGFDSRTGILLLAATNRPEILDPALLRAGRFDRQVLVDNPDQTGRQQILKIHAQKIKMSRTVDLNKIASLTPGFSGADLANLVNEAALVATRRNANEVAENDFTMALERIVGGLERRRRVIHPEEKRRIAFHEMGHATVAMALACAEKVHKVSIIPRGIGALGYTMQRPTEDRYLMTKDELINKIAVLLGGRTSEIKFFGNVSTGAGDDLSKATNIARAMVTQYAMSDRLGLPSFENQEDQFLRNQMPWVNRRPVSDRTSDLIDSEIKTLMDEGENLAKEALEKNQHFIEEGVKQLLENETLDDPQIRDLWTHHGQLVAAASPVRI